MSHTLLTREIKMSEFVRELERNPTSKYRLVLHYIPHVIPLNQVTNLLLIRDIGMRVEGVRGRES